MFKNNNNGIMKRFLALLALAAAAIIGMIYWVYHTGYRQPRIVIGSDADLEAAKYIRRHKLYLLSRIWSDEPVFDPTSEKDLYVLVGGWNANKLSKLMNDTYFHLEVMGEEDEMSIHDQESNDLGTVLCYQFENVVVIWGLHKADTLAAAKVYCETGPTKWPIT